MDAYNSHLVPAVSCDSCYLLITASLYYRGNRIWISYKCADGTWGDMSTGHRKDNAGERRQAEIFCREQTRRERLLGPPQPTTWDWVDGWLETRWGASPRTLEVYRAQWRRLERWLAAIEAKGPANVSRQQCQEYPTWRKEHNGGRNTAVGELKLFAQILEEAVTRGMIQQNVARRLGLKRESTEERRVWTDAELAKVDALLKEKDPYGWQRISFLLGRWQAARLRQAAIPLSDIDLTENSIHYAAPKGGRERAYTQPIAPELIADLRAIVTERRKLGKTTLADLPQFPSLEWRRLLDSLGLFDLSHHDLRRTWITKAAMRGVPESLAMKFTNHKGPEIHRLYMKFSVSDLRSVFSARE